MKINYLANGSLQVMSEGNKVFFTSDLHFCHENIIRFCKRPFKNKEEMEEKLVENWNNVVGEGDLVLNLGDYVFNNRKEWERITSRLNGRQILIMGNHDRKGFNSGFEKLFEHVYPMGVFAVIDDIKMYLTHCPMATFDGMYRGEYSTWNLYGHIHSGPNTQNGIDVSKMKNFGWFTQYDVGVDNNGFTPISFDQVKGKITDQMLSLNLIK